MRADAPRATGHRRADDSLARPRRAVRARRRRAVSRRRGGPAPQHGPPAVLARAGERGLPRERLSPCLAGRRGEEGRNNLAQALYALRRDLGADDAIVGTKELCLNAERVRATSPVRTAVARGASAQAAALTPAPSGRLSCARGRRARAVGGRNSGRRSCTITRGRWRRWTARRPRPATRRDGGRMVAQARGGRPAQRARGRGLMGGAGGRRRPGGGAPARAGQRGDPRAGARPSPDREVLSLADRLRRERARARRPRRDPRRTARSAHAFYRTDGTAGDGGCRQPRRSTPTRRRPPTSRPASSATAPAGPVPAAAAHPGSSRRHPGGVSWCQHPRPRHPQRLARTAPSRRHRARWSLPSPWPPWATWAHCNRVRARADRSPAAAGAAPAASAPAAHAAPVVAGDASRLRARGRPAGLTGRSLTVATNLAPSRGCV